MGGWRLKWPLWLRLFRFLSNRKHSGVYPLSFSSGNTLFSWFSFHVTGQFFSVFLLGFLFSSQPLNVRISQGSLFGKLLFLIDTLFLSNLNNSYDFKCYLSMHRWLFKLASLERISSWNSTPRAIIYLMPLCGCLLSISLLPELYRILVTPDAQSCPHASLPPS